jgi:DNA polymerase-1
VHENGADITASKPSGVGTNNAGGKPPIFLIDTMGFIFRAYHAMARQRPMSTKTGLPTAAIFVFVNMIQKLRDDFAPQYIAAIWEGGPTLRAEQAKDIKSIRKFDAKTQSFLEHEYAGYKAHRTEMPEDLRQQVPYIRRALEAAHIPMLNSEGFEADDVIGTLARQAAEQEHQVFIVSSDKDMMQLVGDHVCVLNPSKDNLICDSAKVEEIIGVPPAKVIDVMALRGDSIDNIPGAPGIGDKGSVELIQKFGSVEEAIAQADQVQRKTYRESLQANADVIRKSKELVTIDTHVPVEIDLEIMRAQDPDYEATRELYSELEFTTLLKNLIREVDTTTADYRDVASVEELLSYLKGADEFALAISPADAAAATAIAAAATEEAEFEAMPLLAAVERASAEPIKPEERTFTLGISTRDDSALTLRVDAQSASHLKTLLEDERIGKQVADAKTAMRILEEFGIGLRGVSDEISLYSYLLNPTYSSHSLPEAALRRFNLKLSGRAAEAADVTGRLARAFRTEIGDMCEVYKSIDLPLVPILARMESVGVAIDLRELSRLSEFLDRESSAIAERVYAIAGERFNINSPKKLGEVLFDKLGLPKPIKYGKGRVVSTAADVLEELAEAHEIARIVLEYRQLMKLKGTYVDALPMLVDPKTGRVHTTFNQASTATGRLSSTNPNLQNIPIKTELGREIRAAFVSKPGNILMSADYSQIELRLLAHFSQDPLLLDAYRTGKDIHTLTACEVFGFSPENLDSTTRNRAKAVNFGIVYGISPFGLAVQLGIEQKTAREYIERYFERYSGVRAYIDRVLADTRATQSVKTMFGRTRPIPDINSKNSNMRGFAERTAVNTPLQGTAADLIKLAMIAIDREMRERKLASKMTLQVHDELVFDVELDEVDEMRELVKRHMESVAQLSVPLDVDLGVGPNWRDME